MKKLITPILLLSLFACQETPIPKPIGYFRIDLPEKQFDVVDSLPFPFQFELPQYAAINLEKTKEDSNFLNIDFPRYGARLHMSYIKVDTNLPKLLNDART
ncbi:MAG: hypothetical protein QMC40_05805 [Vicingaceae bacterium]